MDAAKRYRVLSGLLLALLVASASAADDTDRWAEGRQLFTTAYAAAESGAPAPHGGDPRALQKYPLYPYLQRMRIARGLNGVGDKWTPTDDAARKFLDRHSTLSHIAFRRYLSCLSHTFSSLQALQVSTDSCRHCRQLNCRQESAGN